MGRSHLGCRPPAGRLHGTPCPPPLPASSPPLRGRGLCPGKEHLVTWEGSPGRTSVTFYQASAQDVGLPAGVPHNLSWQRPPHVSGAHKWLPASTSSVISKVLGPGPGSRSLCLVRVPLCPELPLHPPQGLQGNYPAEPSSQPLLGCIFRAPSGG